MKPLKLAVVPIGALCLLSGCMDDKYDLSDIDTTVEVKVTDLTVPVNIDPILLDNLFDLEEDDRIKIVDGYYAVVEEGDIDTDEIIIDRIMLDAPYIESSNNELYMSGSAAESRRRAKADEYVFPMNLPPSSFEYRTDDVSEFIVSMDEIGTEFTFDIDLTLSGLENVVNSGEAKNLKLQIPTGLKLKGGAASYNPATGVYTLSSVPMVRNKINIRIEAVGLDADEAGIKYDYHNHTMDIKGKVAVLDGELYIKNSDLKPSASIPSHITLHSDYTMSDILVTSFSGEMEYKIENTSFTDVDLSGLPDFLSQEGTDIRIVNPQLYLNIYNPLYTYALYADTGMEIKSFGRDDSEKTYMPDNGTFRVAGDVSEPYVKLCLSPTVPKEWYDGFDNSEHVPFTSLSDVLSGNGIPKSLSVRLVNPLVPRQRVSNLLLGVDLGKVHGKYSFFAPLNLKAGSSVVYSKREDGWNDEDIDALTVQALEVNVNVTSDVPLALKLTGYPIDKNGNRINNVDILGGDVQANADSQPVRLYITGEIKHLDGIEFVAVATAADSQVPLNPDMNVKLTNLRAKVSGVYNKEL